MRDFYYYLNIYIYIYVLLRRMAVAWRLGYMQGMLGEDGAWEWEGPSQEDICRILLEHGQGTSAS
jgi:hypothetical protein